ncbi:kinase-like domain-containing protein [Mycotypha africana]|uniref:kinase-like domain-containing protein n=1 Tax=Mycotypha africana TaxID=64632 RepID=UPI002300ED1F|nr:kinase-like domain-containing protein [Mycotypha africana]KAI8966992.1 kinase-like domain-containing protein [Mycotypha africana]
MIFTFLNFFFFLSDLKKQKKKRYQTLSAVSHIHHHNVFHRDMKPENLLLDYSSGKPIIKLADFGLAKELRSSPPYTEYVSTRWYRAPEVLLRSTEYSAPVDLWAVGAIFAELINLEPLFPGESEIDQIYRICDILGSPGNKLVAQQHKKMEKRANDKRLSPGFARKKTKDLTLAELSFLNTNIASTTSTLNAHDGGGEWKEGVKLAFKIGFRFPSVKPKPLQQVIPNATESMLDLIKHFLCFNPSFRWTADYALRHRFFTSETEEESHTVIQLNTPMEPITPPDDGNRTNDNSRLNTPTGILSSTRTILTPKSLLSMPQSSYQFCSHWTDSHPEDHYRPISRDGRTNAISTTTTMHNTHTDSILHGQRSSHSRNSKNAWLIHNRPIYSSHQKVHPISNTPATSNNYDHASYYQLQFQPQSLDICRLDTPSDSEQHHKGSMELSTKRNSELAIDSNAPYCSGNCLKPNDMAHYGCQQRCQAQTIRWTPPHFIKHPRYNDDPEAKENDAAITRHESRRSARRFFYISAMMDTTATSDSVSSTRSMTVGPSKKLWSLSSCSRSLPSAIHLHATSITTAATATPTRFKVWLPVNEANEDNDTEDDEQNCTDDALESNWVPVL